MIVIAIIFTLMSTTFAAGDTAAKITLKTNNYSDAELVRAVNFALHKNGIYDFTHETYEKLP